MSRMSCKPVNKSRGLIPSAFFFLMPVLRSCFQKCKSLSAGQFISMGKFSLSARYQLNSEQGKLGVVKFRGRGGTPPIWAI